MNTESNLLNEDVNLINKIPSGLNTLTILTFIGCGLGLIGILATKFIQNYSLGVMNDPSKMSQLSSDQKEKMFHAKELYNVFDQHFILLTVVGLLGIALCLWGALQMRKLNKQGFYAYAVGRNFTHYYFNICNWIWNAISRYDEFYRVGNTNYNGYTICLFFKVYEVNFEFQKLF